jgi:hypothetical protein
MQWNQSTQISVTKPSKNLAGLATLGILCVAALSAIATVGIGRTSFAESRSGVSTNQVSAAIVSIHSSIESESNQPLFTKKNYPWHIQPKQPIWQAVTSYAPHPLLFALLLLLLTLWVTVWDGLEKGSVDKTALDMSK